MRAHPVPSLRLLSGGLLLVALTAGACRRHPPPPSRRAAPAPAKAGAAATAGTSAPPAAGQPVERVGTLIHAPDKHMPSLPTMFDTSGRLAAVPDKDAGCDLWDLPAQAYVGHVDKAGCERLTWVKPRCLEFVFDQGEDRAPAPTPDSCAFRQAGEHELRSPDGQWVARINGAKLSIEHIGHAGKPVASQSGCGKTECRDILAAAFKPDGTQLAVARKQGTQILVVDSATGKTAKSLKLGAGDILLPDMLGWGPDGLVVLVGKAAADDKKKDAAPADQPTAQPTAQNDPSASDKAGEGSEPADAEGAEAAPSALQDVDTTYLLSWRSLSAHAVRYTNENAFPFAPRVQQGMFLMDPFGRYLLSTYDQRRAGDFLTVFDIQARKDSRLSWAHTDPDGGCSDNELGKPQWIPGPWPVLETIETEGADCSPTYTAWRIYTAPGQRRLEAAHLKKPPGASQVRQVQEDGKTITTLRGAAAKAAGPMPAGDTDGQKRWQATGKTALLRLSDQQELTLIPEGGARTQNLVFDGPLSLFAQEVFLLDPDPIKAQVVVGAQVAHLFQHPHLLDDFLDGKPVAPDPAASAPVGLPPQLDKVAVRYPEGAAANLEVTLLAHDGGAGVGPLRVWAADAPLALPAPLTLLAEQPTPVSLTVPDKTCGHVLLLACNRAGSVCSRPVDVPYCPRKKHKIP